MRELETLAAGLKDIPNGEVYLSEGRSLASSVEVGPSVFMEAFQVKSEAAYKNAKMVAGEVMQHAHLGYRSLGRTIEALHEIYGKCADKGAHIDRFGLCLDWSMGFPRDQRKNALRGTGVVLAEEEDFAKLTNTVPSALHFGDFMLGFPAALENTQAALRAGATTIGNLGQYFTFRLPGYLDDIEPTASTVKALGLIAAQPVPVLVHSNLDDGFAAVYEDLGAALGQAMLEKYIIRDLIGAHYTVCYGHHFTDPLTRIAFQRALAAISDDVPGSQVYGATVLYKGDMAENYASMASYLMADIVAQTLLPSGHAVNPVPVTENKRIPDMDEIIDAQLNLHRLKQLAPDYAPLFDLRMIDQVRDELLKEGEGFKQRALIAFEAAGIDVKDPFALLLAIRRLGGRQMENLFGGGKKDVEGLGKRIPIIPATTYLEIQQEAQHILGQEEGLQLKALGERGLRILTSTSDVHEHGKMLLDQVFVQAGIKLVDGGVSANPEEIAQLVALEKPDAIALSTYNGVAYSFAEQLVEALKKVELDCPILIGGRLNQIPEDSNSSLPVDVSQELRSLGVYPCADLKEASKFLSQQFSEIE